LYIQCSFFALLLYGIRNYKYYEVTDSIIIYQNTIIIKMLSVFQAKKSKKEISRKKSKNRNDL